MNVDSVDPVAISGTGSTLRLRFALAGSRAKLQEFCDHTGFGRRESVTREFDSNSPFE